MGTGKFLLRRMCPCILGVIDLHQIKPVGRCDRGTGGTIASFERGGNIVDAPFAFPDKHQGTYH